MKQKIRFYPLFLGIGMASFLCLGVWAKQPHTGYPFSEEVQVVDAKTSKETSIHLLPTLANAWTADVTVMGVVTDEQKEPLVGVTVVVKGTSTGTVTDSQGRYTLMVPSGDATLVFSFIGYLIEEVPLNGRTQVDVGLVSDIANLGEVVVIGYQTVKKKDLTGATGVVNMADVRKISSQSVAEAIQGVVPGVTVRNGGAPGANAVIEIRGISTFGSTSPLYVIDGMLAEANTTVNPADIASIQILKDASAAAIYGSRAANGVVIITTKKGEDGPAKISISARYGIQQLPKRWNVMDAPQYLKTVQLQYQNSGLPLASGIAAQLAKNTINTDWQDAVFRIGEVQDYNVGISQGSKNGNFLVSMGYYKNKGVLIDNEFQRASLRLNSETRKGRFTFGENMMLSNSNGKNPGGVNAFYESALSLPIIAVKGPQYATIPNNPQNWGMGTFEVPSYASNYVATAALDQQSNNFAKIVGNAYASVKIINGLTYKFNVGVEASYDYFKGVRYDGIWRYANQNPGSSINESRQRFTNLLLEHLVNFDRTFGKHSVSAVVGFSRTQQKREVTTGSRAELLTASNTVFTTISSATGQVSADGGIPLFWRAHGYLARVNYTYDDRYLLTLTGRMDRDSRFSEAYNTGYFPSVAAAWRISKESFFSVKQIDELKLRASYGTLGYSDVLGSWQYIPLISRLPRAVYGTSQQPQAGAYQAISNNPDLRWETRIQKNIGIDATVLENRLLVSVDVYNSLSKDLLRSFPLLATAGYAPRFSPTVNAASVRNTGVEFSATLKSKPSSVSPFKWDVSANFTTIKNKVVSLGNTGIDAEGNALDYLEFNNFIRAQVGHSIGQWFVIKTDGIFKSQQEIDNHTNKDGKVIQSNAKPGDIRFVDANGDGTINDKDRQYAGSPWPTLQTGMQFNLGYKQFSLNLQLIGVFGNKLYNDVSRALDSYELSNFRKDIDPWSPTNPNGKDPRLAASQPTDLSFTANNMSQTDRWLESGSYVRVRNLELGYTVPQPVLSKVGFSNARIYISGQNLFTVTKYRGLDPDVQGAGTGARGFDTGNWPSSRIISVGILTDF